MKISFYIFLSAIIALASCSGKTKTSLNHDAPNGHVKINIEAKRTTAIESWKVDMNVKAYDFKEGKLSFEIYAEDLTNDNVTFEWVDERHCNITFKQQDGELRKFQLIASSEQLQMAEVQ